MVARAKKITELNTATSISNTDLLIVEQVGVNTSATKKVTANTLASYVAGQVGAVSGTKGEKGEPGVAGTSVKGDKGDPGTIGDTGLTGAKGDKGDAGTNGNDGAKGEPGVTGDKGDKGEPAAGGGATNQLVNINESFVLDTYGNVIFEGANPGEGVNRGIVWDYGVNNANGVNSEIRQDGSGITVRAWTEDGGGANGLSAPVRIVTNQGANEKVWNFDGDGNLTLPGDLTRDEEVKVTVGNSDYWAIVNRANNGDSGVHATAVAYDTDDSVYTLHINQIYDQAQDTNLDILVVSKYSYSGDLVWQKQLDKDVDVDSVHDICVDAEGDLIIAISADNGGNDDTIVLMKLSWFDGAIIWQKDYHGIVPTAVRSDPVSPFSNTPEETTFNGNPAQRVQLGGDYSDFIAGSRLEESTDGGITYTSIGTLIGCVYDSNTSITSLYFNPSTIVSLDYPTNTYTLLGNIPNTHLEVGGITTDGTDIWVSGYYEEDVNTNIRYGFVMKALGSNGNLSWAKALGYSDTVTDLYSIDYSPDGHVVVAGVVEPPQSSTSGPIAMITKIDGLTGQVIWSKPIVGSENDVDEVYVGADLTIDSLGNIYVAVNSRQKTVNEAGNNWNVTTTYITKVNTLGAVQWARRFGPGPCDTVGTGIDCDGQGNIYFSNITVIQTNPARDFDNWNDQTQRAVLSVAKCDTNGNVLWQRIIESDSYFFFESYDNENLGGYNAQFNRGRNLSVSETGKIAIQADVAKKVYTSYDTIYTETITFQIDQDGRELTIGEGSEMFTVRASRTPSTLPTMFRTLPFVAPNVVVVPQVNESLSLDDIDVTTAAFLLQDGVLAQQIAKTASYDYVFGNDGSLTIPNNGDIKLTQEQLGWFSIFGPAYNYVGDVNVHANVVDPRDGSVYLVGQTSTTNSGFVAKYDSAGQVVWSIKTIDNNDGNNNRCRAVKIHPITGNLCVLIEYYGLMTNTVLVQIDPETARVVTTVGVRDTNNDNDCSGYDIDFMPNGNVVVVGQKYDEFKADAVTPQTGSGVGTLFVLRSDVGGTPTTDWYVSGTGITGRTIVDNIDRYPGLVSTTNGSGTGCTATIFFNPDGTIGGVWSFDTPGQNYQVGDTLTFAGTQFPGGTSPANDIVMTIIDNGAPNGGVNGTDNGTMTGTIPTTHWRIATTAQTPDYSAEGASFSLLQPLNGEAFVLVGDADEWGVVWSKVMSAGGTSNDRYTSVDVDSNGNIYAVGTVRSTNGAATGLNNDDCAVVSKFSSDGTHQWTKALNDTAFDCIGYSVAANDSGVVVSHLNDDSGYTILTKLDSTGSIKWQRRTQSQYYSSSVAMEDNGDVYWAVTANLNNPYGDLTKLIKLNALGEIEWQKFFGTRGGGSYDTLADRMNEGRNLTIDANHIYVSGYTFTYADASVSGFLTKIPKAGNSDGYYGSWAIQQAAYNIDLLGITSATSFTPLIGTGDFETVGFDFIPEWWDPSDSSYYHIFHEMRSRDGGAIVFPDGTRQTTSAQLIPQRRISTGADHRLQLEDCGKHIYVTNSGMTINVPYFEDVPLPNGFNVTIVNDSGGNVNIDADGINMTIKVPGQGSNGYWDLQDVGIAKLIKVDNYVWFMEGNVTMD